MLTAPSTCKPSMMHCDFAASLEQSYNDNTINCNGSSHSHWMPTNALRTYHFPIPYSYTEEAGARCGN